MVHVLLTLLINTRHENYIQGWSLVVFLMLDTGRIAPITFRIVLQGLVQSAPVQVNKPCRILINKFYYSTEK